MKETRYIWQLAIGCMVAGFGSLIVATVHMPSYAIASWRLLIATLIFGIVIIWKGIPFPRLRSTYFFAVLAGIFGASDLMLWHDSIRTIGPGIATLLNSLQVLCLAVIGVFFFAERLNRWQVVSCILAVLGIALVATPEFKLNEHALFGVLTGLISALVFALAMVCIRKAHDYEPLHVLAMMFIMTVSGLIWILPFAYVQSGSYVLPEGLADWLRILVYGAVMQCLAWSAISGAIAHVPLALTGLLMLLQPVTSLLFDVCLLDKSIQVEQMLGAGLSLFSIYIGSVRRSRGHE